MFNAFCESREEALQISPVMRPDEKKNMPLPLVLYITTVSNIDFMINYSRIQKFGGKQK